MQLLLKCASGVLHGARGWCSCAESLLPAGVCSLRGSTTGVARVAHYTLVYYAITTATSVLLGIVLVLAIRPGRGEPLEDTSNIGCGRQVRLHVTCSPWSVTCSLLKDSTKPQ